MDVTNITTTDYENFIDSNSTNDYNIITNNIIDNCTDNGNNIDMFIPTILLKKPCGLSFLGSMSLFIYTLLKLLKTNK